MLELRRDGARPPVKLTPRLAFLLTLPPLLWAGNAVVGRWIAGGLAAGQPGASQVPPLTLNLLRWVLCALILLPLGWRALRPVSRITRRWPYLLALGVLGVGLFNSLQYLALVSSSPLNVTLVAASMPVWMLAVGALVYGEHPSPRQLAGAALGLAGVALVVGRGSWHSLARVHFVPGDLYMLLAVIGWAFYSWLLARPPAHMRGAARPTPEQGWDWAGVLLVQTLFGLVAASAFSAGEQALGASPMRWSWGVVAALAYVSAGASVVAYRCWGLGVAEGGPALAAFFNNLTPLFAALLSVLLLGEAPQRYHGAAFALIVGGIAVSTLRLRPRAPKETPVRPKFP
jgi:drug/metabolite transporter (DMT)-like permease